jgi:hypothetical protein
MPPPGEGFDTDIVSVPILASDAAGTVALNVPSVFRVVGNAVAPTRMVDFDINPLPDTVNNVAGAPSGMLAGEIAAIDGVGLLRTSL